SEANPDRAFETHAASEHDRRVEPSIESVHRVDSEAPARVVDDFAEVGIRKASRAVLWGRAVTGLGATRPGSGRISAEIGIAGLVEGDEVRLHQGVPCAQIELHVLTRLPSKLGAERVAAVGLDVREPGKVDLL